ncbi:MAG: alpha-mannosyltransferase [Simkania sp.]|nr:alpha-mannosyltransferase [Simkania sp.]
MQIPKKLHLTFATEELPERYQRNLEAWRSACHDWEICFYTDDEVYALFKEHFPQYYEILPQIPCGAMLADFFRYAVLYVHGGMYTDMDTYPLKFLPEKWLSASSVIGYEVQTKAVEVFCQWTMLSKPKYPLFKEALEQAFQKFIKNLGCIDHPDQVLETTGPLFFSSIVNQYRFDPELLLLETDYFARCPEAGLPFTERSFVRHQFDGEWTWKLSLACPQLRLNRGGL